MSSYRREVWATLSQLLQQVAARETQTAVSDLATLQEEVRKLGKTQFKANTLTERQIGQWEKTVAELKATQAQNQVLQKQLQTGQQQNNNHSLLLALMPVLDDLEQALAYSQRQLEEPEKSDVLASWLEGMRLIYERFLAILERNGVHPISSVGQPFDPYYHRAVGATAQLSGETAVPPGYIVAEERRGYQSDSGVLRYADVIVYKPDERA